MNLFGFGEDAKKSVVDAVISAGDSLVLTDEEQIEFSKEKVKLVTEAIKVEMEAKASMHPFKRTQRMLAFGFSANFILSFWFGVILFFWYPTYFDGFINLVGEFSLGYIMMMIIVFYFKFESLDIFKKVK